MADKINSCIEDDVTFWVYNTLLRRLKMMSKTALYKEQTGPLTLSMPVSQGNRSRAVSVSLRPSGLHRE